MAELTSAQVWQAVQDSSAAVLGHVTAAGAPRTSGVVYVMRDHRVYVAVEPDSWKARQISTGDQVSMTVLVRRGGVLSLMFPIPPATITFQGTATVHPADSVETGPLLAGLERLVPPDRRQNVTVLEISPQGHFLTYGIGIPLREMRQPALARARVPVS